MRNMVQNLQLKSFLDELVSKLVKEYPDEIVSFVLFGSATTGEWIRGKSDIDCIVIIKNKKLNDQIEKYLIQLLFALDAKYDLKLSDTCTSYKKTEDTMTMKKIFVILYMLKSTKFVYGLYAVTLRKLFKLSFIENEN